jgi:hypothetical protein
MSYIWSLVNLGRSRANRPAAGRTARRRIGKGGWGALLGAGVLATMVVVPATGGRAATTAPKADTRPVSAAHQVTLITGDRLTVADGTKELAIRPGTGRAGVGFLRRTSAAGHLEVIPLDALGLVNSGRLDERLFDLTDLTTFGYDDRRPDLPLLVRTDGTAGALTSGALAGARVTRQLAAVGTAAVSLDRKDAPAFWRSSPVARPVSPPCERMSARCGWTASSNRPRTST